MPSSARQSNQLILSMLSHTVHCQRLQLRLFLRAIVAPHCSLCLGRCVPLSQRVATPAMITKPIAWNRVGTAFIALMKREARHRLERHYNTCANRKKQCRPNETKPYLNATHPRKRQNIPTNGHTPSRIKSTHTRLTYTRDAPARARSPGGWLPSTCTHRTRHNPTKVWMQRQAGSPPRPPDDRSDGHATVPWRGVASWSLGTGSWIGRAWRSARRF